MAHHGLRRTAGANGGQPSATSVYPTDRVRREGRVIRGGPRLGPVESRLAIRSPSWLVSQRWQHRRERASDDEAGEPEARRDFGACTGVGRTARGWRDGFIEPCTYGSTAMAGDAGKRLPTPVEGPASLRGSRDHPGGGCAGDFGPGCALTPGLGGCTDSVLVMTGFGGLDLSGGNVGEGTFGRFVRSCRRHCGA